MRSEGEFSWGVKKEVKLERLWTRRGLYIALAALILRFLRLEGDERPQFLLQIFLGIAVVFVVLRMPRIRRFFRDRYRVKRGSDIETINAQRAGKKPRGTFFFGGRYVPSHLSMGLVGIPGSGKTLQLSMILSEILSDLMKEEKGRVLIREYKRGDFIPLVHASGIPYKRIDPSTPGSYAWNIAKDCKSDPICDDIAFTLFPQKPGEHEFFPMAARTVTAEVMKGLRASVGTNWTFWDLFHIMSDPALIIEISKRAPMKGKPTETIIESARSSGDSLATIAVRITPLFQGVAAAWKDAPLLSLEEFVTSKGILFLGHSTTTQNAMSAISSAITERLIKYVLDFTDRHSYGSTYFFLDELSTMARVPGLEELMKAGRGKKGIPIAGLQDIGSLEITYGEKEARTIFGLFNSLCILESVPDTAKYICDFLGEVEIEHDQYSMQSGLSGRSSLTISTQRGQRRRLEPWELYEEYPQTCPENGLYAYYRGYHLRVKKTWRTTLPWNLIMERIPKVSVKELSELPPRSITHFTEADRKRLGIHGRGTQKESGGLKELTNLWNKVYPNKKIPSDMRIALQELSSAFSARRGKVKGYRPKDYGVE
jgi:hypothetical protein